MDWVDTELTKAELIAKLLKPHEELKCIANQCKGNGLWCVWEYSSGAFLSFILFKKTPGKLSYKILKEKEFESTSCPSKYLTMVPEVVNPQWRESVDEYKKIWEMRKEIVRKYQKLDSGTHIVVQTTKSTWARGDQAPKLIVEGYRPLVGRYKGRLYYIETKNVESYEIL